MKNRLVSEFANENLSIRRSFRTNLLGAGVKLASQNYFLNNFLTCSVQTKIQSVLKHTNVEQSNELLKINFLKC